MNILFIGDIVGSPGRRAVEELLTRLVDQHLIDLVVANGENASGGIGITPQVADLLLGQGIDLLTSGNHIWKHKEISLTCRIPTGCCARPTIRRGARGGATPSWRPRPGRRRPSSIWKAGSSWNPWTAPSAPWMPS